MIIRENVLLAPYTTLRIGGAARFFIETESDADVREAIEFARERGLPLRVLGAGSNVLVPDGGVDAVVVKPALRAVTFVTSGMLIADAGAPWDTVVDAAGARGLFGIENLAGIPGTMGGAVVQNIGAYGSELSSVFAYADVIDVASGEAQRVGAADAAFGYRTSVFKRAPGLVLTRVALEFDSDARTDLSYADLAAAQRAGESLSTPAEVAAAVRRIRAGKFPADGEGTAGSFFKNPVVSEAQAAALKEQFPGIPAFPQAGGVKIPLAWLLDRALGLKGHAHGSVRLYERQPLVLVAHSGATAAEVDAFAREIAERVRAATGIAIEREVETFAARA